MALASLPRGLKTEVFDEPLAVVAVAQPPQGRLEFVEIREAPHPERLFVEGDTSA